LTQPDTGEQAVMRRTESLVVWLVYGIHIKQYCECVKSAIDDVIAVISL